MLRKTQKKGDVRNDPKKKDEQTWTLHEKILFDDEYNGKRGGGGRKRRFDIIVGR